MKRVQLKKGEKAPFDGQLLSDAAVAKLLSDYKAKVLALEAEIKFLKGIQKTKLDTATETCKVRVDAEATKKKICEDTRTAEKMVYSQAIDRIGKQSEQRWYESPYLHLILGMGLGTGACVAATR